MSMEIILTLVGGLVAGAGALVLGYWLGPSVSRFCDWIDKRHERRYDRLRAKYPKPDKGSYNAPGNF